MKSTKYEVHVTNKYVAGDLQISNIYFMFMYDYPD